MAVRKELGRDLNFSYRHSRLKTSDDIVLEVTLHLTPGKKEELMNKRMQILNTRSDKHPDLSKEPCAGSIFRNIEPTSKAEKRKAAGWFLDQAGAKELRRGKARIFAKHANIIIAENKCKAQDVYLLARQMEELVKQKFNFDLVREVRFLGNFKGEKQPYSISFW